MKSNIILIVLLSGMLSANSVANAQQPTTSEGSNSSTEQPAPPSQPANKAKIYVYRDGSTVGAANHPMIFVNDDFLADLHNSEYAPLEVPAGAVVFSFLPKSTVDLTVVQALGNHLTKKKHELLRMELEAGKTYYFKWSYAGFGGAHPLKLIDADKGAKEMKGLHPAKDLAKK